MQVKQLYVRETPQRVNKLIKWIDNQIDRHLDEGFVLEQKNTLQAPIRIKSFQAIF